MYTILCGKVSRDTFFGNALWECIIQLLQCDERKLIREGGRFCVYTLYFVKRSLEILFLEMHLGAAFGIAMMRRKEREGASHTFVKKVEWKWKRNGSGCR